MKIRQTFKNFIIVVNCIFTFITNWTFHYHLVVSESGIAKDNLTTIPMKHNTKLTDTKKNKNDCFDKDNVGEEGSYPIIYFDKITNRQIDAQL